MTENDRLRLVIAALVRRLGGQVELSESELTDYDHEFMTARNEQGDLVIIVEASGEFMGGENDS